MFGVTMRLSTDHRIRWSVPRLLPRYNLVIMQNSASIAAAKSEEEGTPAGGFKIFNRIVDWITNDRLQLINVTDRINEIVRKSGIRDGIVHLQSLHTTTAVFINEWQDALLHDVRTFLEDLVSRDNYFR